jgi:hypothetical protein
MMKAIFFMPFESLKHRFVTTILVCASGLLFCTCTAYHTGSVSTVLLPPKSKIIDMAMGTAKAHYFLGLGGMGKDGLVLEAKKELYRGYPLKKNQAYGNMTLDAKRSYYILYWNTKVTLSADIIDYDSVTNQDGLLKDRVSKWNDWNKLLSDNLTTISVGDSVSFQDYTENLSNAFLGRVLSIHKNTARVGRFIQGVYDIKKVGFKKLLPMKPFPGCDLKTKYKLGEKILYEVYYDRRYVLLEGIVVNVVSDLYLLQSKYNGKSFYNITLEKYIKQG